LTIFDNGPGLFRPDISLGVPSGRWRRAGLDLRAVRRLRSTVRNLAPSAVVAHGGEALKYLSVAGLRRVPLAYHKIGTITADFGWRQRLSHAFGLRRAHTVVAISDDARREVMALGRSDAISIPNGRDEQRWRPRARTQPPQVMFVGAMNGGKRPDVFIDVVRALRAGGVECRAAMIGDGPLDLRAAAESAQIQWWGARDDVPDLLGAADVLVFTSLPAGEGLPGILVEAGMCEVACVAAEVPGTNEAIVDGVTGMVVVNGPAEDVARRITAALTELLTDTDRLRAMQRAARSHCVARFSISEYRRRWATVIDEMRL
jgi:glycosyltransferase involved in cell wall biosynthesis